jgi:hypothetical protein
MRGARAFTLVEAIGAIVLLAIAVPPMLWALRASQIERADPLMISRARWLASEKLEDVIADRYSAVRGFDYITGARYPAEATIAGSPGFSRRVSIAETGPDLASPGSGYLTVIVSVEWDASAGPQSLAISTVLTEHPRP